MTKLDRVGQPAVRRVPGGDDPVPAERGPAAPRVLRRATRSTSASTTCRGTRPSPSPPPSPPPWRLRFLLFRTRSGVAMRAVVDDRDLSPAQRRAARPLGDALVGHRLVARRPRRHPAGRQPGRPDPHPAHAAGGQRLRRGDVRAAAAACRSPSWAPCSSAWPSRTPSATCTLDTPLSSFFGTAARHPAVAQRPPGGDPGHRPVRGAAVPAAAQGAGRRPAEVAARSSRRPARRAGSSARWCSRPGRLRVRHACSRASAPSRWARAWPSAS